MQEDNTRLWCLLDGKHNAMMQNTSI